MSKSAPQISVLTANRLGDGIVVFLDFEGAWNESIAEAVVARDPDEARALEDRGAYDAAHNLVVEPYLIEMREEAGRLTPIRTRERIRVAGPSILADVPGYASPSPRAQEGVRPFASDVTVSRNRGGEGSDPLPASGERESLTQAA